MVNSVPYLKISITITASYSNHGVNTPPLGYDGCELGR